MKITINETIGLITAAILVRRYMYMSEGLSLEEEPTKHPIDSDYDDAETYALKKLCAERGYQVHGKHLTACAHTKSTCESGPSRSNTAGEYGEWIGTTSTGKCIAHEVNYKKWCGDTGLTHKGDASGVVTCKTNQNYCSSKQVDWKNGDCYLNPAQWVAESILGTTVTRVFRRLGEDLSSAGNTTEVVNAFADATVPDSLVDLVMPDKKIVEEGGFFASGGFFGISNAGSSSGGCGMEDPADCV